MDETDTNDAKAEGAKAIAVIPARLDSARVPRKALADLAGKPLVWHVWDRVRRASSVALVAVATDADEIADTMEAAGARVFRTGAAANGTARIAGLLGETDAAFVVNVQGDQPLVSPDLVDAVVARWRASGAELVTVAYPIGRAAALGDPAIVKMARAETGAATSFSRRPIPHAADADADPEGALRRHRFWGHVGIYGYARAALARYAALPPSDDELRERLEQLRFVAAGERFDVVETESAPWTVDTPEQLAAVRALLARTA